MNHWKAVLEQDFLTGIMLQRGNGTTQNDTFGYNPRSERVTWDPSQATATRPLAIQKDGTWLRPHEKHLRSLRCRRECDVDLYGYGNVSDPGNISVGCVM